MYRSTFKLKEGRSYFKNKSNRPLFIQRYLKKNRVIEISLKSLYRNLLFVIFLTLSKRTFSLFFFFFFFSISGEKKSKFPTLLLFSTDEFVLYIYIIEAKTIEQPPIKEFYFQHITERRVYIPFPLSLKLAKILNPN